MKGVKTVLILILVCATSASAWALPRVTETPVDYMLMPFLVYAGVIVAVQFFHRALQSLAP